MNNNLPSAESSPKFPRKVTRIPRNVTIFIAAFLTATPCNKFSHKQNAVAPIRNGGSNSIQSKSSVCTRNICCSVYCCSRRRKISRGQCMSVHVNSECFVARQIFKGKHKFTSFIWRCDRKIE